jgi:hypothetical protein
LLAERPKPDNRISIKTSARDGYDRHIGMALNPDCPNPQVRFVRTKATRMDPRIFVIFVRTPVFSRTIFVRTNSPPSRSSCAQTPSSCAQQFIQTSLARWAARADAASETKATAIDRVRTRSFAENRRCWEGAEDRIQLSRGTKPLAEAQTSTADDASIGGGWVIAQFGDSSNRSD